jgi:GT2 family glycosyltransferase
MLDRALDSIYRNAPACDFEVLVVDNASTDGSLEMIRTKYPRVILTVNEQRLGYPANSNINMRKAQGEYCLVLNEDIEILPNSLDIGIAYMDQHQEIGMLGCCMLLPNGKVMYTSGRHFPTISTQVFGWTTLSERFPHSHLFGHELMSYWAHDTIREVDTVQEAGMFVRRTAMEQVGMMDENLFFCFDGPEWTQRFWRSGWQVVFHPGVQIIHYHGQSSNKGGRPNYFLLVEALRSGQYYFNKYHGWFYALAYRMVMASIFLGYSVKHTLSIFLTHDQNQRAARHSRRETALVTLLWYLGGDGMLKLFKLPPHGK